MRAGTLNVGNTAGKLSETADKVKDVEDGNAMKGGKRSTTEKIQESNKE